MADFVRNVKSKFDSGKEWLVSRPKLGWYLTFFLFLNYVFDLARIFQ